MKPKIISTVAAIVLAGVAGLTLATEASAMLKPGAFANLCAKVDGGLIHKYGMSSFSGWKTDLCVRHSVITDAPRLLRAVGSARFKQFEGLSATPQNMVKCINSSVILHFHKYHGGKWTKITSKKKNAVPKIVGGKIKECSASVATGYAHGSTQYRTVVFATPSDGTTNARRASLIRSEENALYN